MEKVLNFIKQRLVEIAGLLIAIMGIFLFYFIINHQPNNPILIFPSDNEIFLLIRYITSFTDFILQAFGLVAFGISINLFFLGVIIAMQKKDISISISFLFITLYLICGSLFFNTFNNQSFCLTAQGNGGFLGSYLQTLLASFSVREYIIIYCSLFAACIFFILSLNLSVSNWKNIFLISITPFSFLKSKISSSESGTEAQGLDSFKTHN